MGDLDRRSEIHDAVVGFYREVVCDDILGPVFDEVAEVDWAKRIPKLIDYWCRVLLGERGYAGAMLDADRRVHQLERFRAEQFARWPELWEHSVFWATLSPDGGGEPTGALANLLDEESRGVAGFRLQMTEAAATIHCSGWALASWEPVAGHLVVQQVYDHQGNHGQGTIPLLAIDAWEHAYYLPYENQKGQFAVWNIVPWTDVAARLDAARREPA